MATTKIDYKDDKGFWIAESFMQLVMHYIFEEVKKTQYSFLNKQDLLEDMEFDINGYRHGYLVLMWDELLTTPSDEQTMIQVLQNVKSTLQDKGHNISVAELKEIESEDPDFKRLYSLKPFPTSELVKIIDALIQMLEGTWTSTNYDMKIDYGYYE